MTSQFLQSANESPVLDSPESPPKTSSGESDLEPEMVYTVSSAQHLDVDPGLVDPFRLPLIASSDHPCFVRTFSVTTPTKPNAVFGDEEGMLMAMC